MKAKIEDIFLTYANYPLSDDPANLVKTYDIICNHVRIPEDIQSITTLSIQLLTEFAEFENFSDANSYKDKLKTKKGRFSSVPIHTMGHTTVSELRGVVIESTFSCVFGYKEGYCRHLCPSFEGVRKMHALGKKHIEGPPHLKCFNCDQQYVRYILDEIVKGKEFSQIIGFSQFLESGRMVFRSGLSIRKTASQIPYKEIITEEAIYDPKGHLLTPVWLIGSAVAYSLGNFLVKTDSKKKNPLFLRLKKCVRCGKFKIANRVTQMDSNTFCSIECNDLFHRERRKKTKYHSTYMKEYRKL